MWKFLRRWLELEFIGKLPGRKWKSARFYQLFELFRVFKFLAKDDARKICT